MFESRERTGHVRGHAAGVFVVLGDECAAVPLGQVRDGVDPVEDRTADTDDFCHRSAPLSVGATVPGLPGTRADWPQHISLESPGRINTVGHKYVNTLDRNMPPPACSRPNRQPNGGLARVRQYKDTAGTPGDRNCPAVTRDTAGRDITDVRGTPGWRTFLCTYSRQYGKTRRESVTCTDSLVDDPPTPVVVCVLRPGQSLWQRFRIEYPEAPEELPEIIRVVRDVELRIEEVLDLA